MKAIALAVLTLMVILISHPSFGATCPREDSPPKASLVVDKQEYPIAESADVIKKAFSKIDAKKADNIIFYIHGRGKEPEKSELEIIPPLQKEYTASVIMFHWCPSWTGPGGFPDENAKAAADEFATFVTALKNFLSQNQQYSNTPVTLLTHSMGAFVLEGFSSQGLGPLPTNMFNTIVLNAAAVKADGHANC